jgi:hypothetical protein
VDVDKNGNEGLPKVRAVVYLIKGRTVIISASIPFITLCG